MTLASLAGLLRLAAPAAIFVRLAIGLAQAHPLYDTTGILVQQGNACLKPVGCKVIPGDQEVIRRGAAAVITMRCPAATPYFQGWDIRRHEHIKVELLDYDRKSLKVVAVNPADTSGTAKIYIGCSTKSIEPSSLMQSAGGFPTKPLKKN